MYDINCCVFKMYDLFVFLKNREYIGVKYNVIEIIDELRRKLIICLGFKY